MEVDKSKLDLLLKRGENLSRKKISKILGVSDSEARDYRALLDNVSILRNENGENHNKNYLVLGCIHFPFENKEIVSGIYDLMRDVEFDGIVLAGDILDMASLSSYDKGRVLKSGGATLEDEYDYANIQLNIIDKLMKPSAEKVFMFGNHEDRYWKWKSDVDNSKYGDALNPIRSLNLEKRGYRVYSDYTNDVHNIGSLSIIHGEYFNVHCAKKHLDVFRRNILFFHTHRMQSFREGDFASYNGGFLGDKTSVAFNYAKRGMKSAWANGFATVTLDDSGEHFVNLVSCVNNKFVYNGKTYGGEKYVSKKIELD